jgi:hypothetical protein
VGMAAVRNKLVISIDQTCLGQVKRGMNSKSRRATRTDPGWQEKELLIGTGERPDLLSRSTRQCSVRAFRKAHAVRHRHQVPQEIRGSGVERSESPRPHELAVDQRSVRRCIHSVEAGRDGGGRPMLRCTAHFAKLVH